MLSVLTARYFFKINPRHNSAIQSGKLRSTTSQCGKANELESIPKGTATYIILDVQTLCHVIKYNKYIFFHQECNIYYI